MSIAFTAMPFGACYLADGPIFWPSAPGWSPEKGLAQAIEVLGWSCRTWYGGSVDEALAELRDGLRSGPVLIGPVDFGYLSYSPSSQHMAGADHYVMALGLEQEHVRVHDPAGYPYAVLPMPDFLDAWRAERIRYRQGSYTLRASFTRQRDVGRQDVIQQTLPRARELARTCPGGPTVFGGSQALTQLAAALHDGVPAGLAANLLGFSLPTAARRTTDAARFLDEGGQAAAARLMQRMAVLWGTAVSRAAQQRWTDVAVTADQLASVATELADAL